ncbi:amino acid ABC transporter substrate-binding protein [Mesorhizobium waimense]|uniref:Amino acid ABC transporter substrate-binding protein n=1 Tax=Mesorhizobium waimense TaxID=1300307 RepID=A0A3A5K3X0_9HYPH|nr:amino acid ABC transporter substrate-binding protein [Mesorhizobium waimense]
MGSNRAWPLVSFACAVLAAFSTPSLAGETLDRIKQSGQLLSPYPDIWPPYVIKGEDGELMGFDVEVLREIGRRLGVEVKYVTGKDGSIYTWEEQTTGQWNGNYYIVVNSMTPTAERAKHVAFPVTYYYALGVLAVHRDNTTIKKPSDASGKRIGALKSANYELYLRRKPFGIVDAPPVVYKIDNPIVVTYDHEEEAFEALAKGDGVELDGVVNYLPVVMALIKDGRPFRVIGQPLYRVPQSVAIMPGDPELADLLKKTVDEMHADGTLRTLSMKWFDFDLTEK